MASCVALLMGAQSWFTLQHDTRQDRRIGKKIYTWQCLIRVVLKVLLLQANICWTVTKLKQIELTYIKMC